MKEVFYLSREQMKQITPYFPKSRGVSRVDDRKIISAIIYVIKNGLQWKDAPREYGPHKTLYNRFIRWSRAGVFVELAKKEPASEHLKIDATHLKAHRTAASLHKKGLFAAALVAPRAG